MSISRVSSPSGQESTSFGKTPNNSLSHSRPTGYHLYCLNRLRRGKKCAFDNIRASSLFLCFSHPHRVRHAPLPSSSPFSFFFLLHFFQHIHLQLWRFYAICTTCLGQFPWSATGKSFRLFKLVSWIGST